MLVFNFFNKKKIIKIINLIIFILFILIIFLPNGTYLLWKLENTNSKPQIFSSNIDGIIKVKIPILERYSSLGIELYSEKYGTNDDKFPFTVSEEFLEYERKYLLI